MRSNHSLGLFSILLPSLALLFACTVTEPELHEASPDEYPIEFVRLRRDVPPEAMKREPPRREKPVPAQPSIGGNVESLGATLVADHAFDRERYDAIEETRFASPFDAPRSTFAIDVDTASYSNVRRFLAEGRQPPRGAVRVEELINYFEYAYEPPTGDAPFSVTTELAPAPWKPDHWLLRVGLQAAVLEARDVPPRNLVFLVDVSGSMQMPQKLTLVKRALRALTLQLRETDRVSIVVYAGASGLALPPTSGRNPGRILSAIEALEAGGSTNGGEGIRLAYAVARSGFDPDAVNRVILATDGDFNVGVTSRSDLMDLIERERESGVFLTVLGVGGENLNDAGMEELADHGNGNYAYLDSIAEARKVLVEEAGGTLVTVAKDVKIQIEFNPRHVGAYRLIGYENRALADRDFDDDRVDAGEIGAGHSVTALYEIVPVGLEDEVETGVGASLRYQRGAKEAFGHRDELALVRLRYKEPQGDESALLAHAVPTAVGTPSDDLRFGAAVALFGMLLRDSDFAGDGDFALVKELARSGLGADRRGLRAQFVHLTSVAQLLSDGVALAPPE